MIEPSSLAYIVTARMATRNGSQQQRWELGLDVMNEDGTTTNTGMIAFQDQLDALSVAGYCVGYWSSSRTYVLKCKIPVNVTPHQRWGYRIDMKSISPRKDNYTDAEYAADKHARLVKTKDLRPGDIIMKSVLEDGGRGLPRKYYHYRLLSKPERRQSDDPRDSSMLWAEVEWLDDYHGGGEMYMAGEQQTRKFARHNEYLVLNYDYDITQQRIA